MQSDSKLKTGKILQKLADTITKLGKSNDVKVIVLKSTGDKAFCAGASFDELINIDDLDKGEIFFSGFLSSFFSNIFVFKFYFQSFF